MVWVNKPTIFFRISAIFQFDALMEAKHKVEVRIQFGKRLAALRKKKKLSFRKLSVQCDVDPSDIKKYEKGKKDLRLTTVVDLASGLGVHPSELLNFNFDFLQD